MNRIVIFFVTFSVIICCASCGHKSIEQEISDNIHAKIIGKWRNSNPNAIYEDDPILAFFSDGTVEIVSWACGSGVRPLKEEKDGSISGLVRSTEDGGLFYLDKAQYSLHNSTIKIKNMAGEVTSVEFYYDGDNLIMMSSNKKIRFERIHVNEYSGLRSPMACRNEKL